MYLSYFTADPFPMAQGASAGPYMKFPGVPGLGFYRPNQALNRVYTTRAALNGMGAHSAQGSRLRGLGDLTDGTIGGVDVSMPLLIGGGVLLAVALGMFGRKKYRAARSSSLRRKRTRISSKIRQLEA